MRGVMIALALLAHSGAAHAEPRHYALDPTHSQAVFYYNHAGFSTTAGMFSGFEGEIVLDVDDLASSTVTATIAVETMFTGLAERDSIFLESGEFFKVRQFPGIRFQSTGVEVTGEKTALVTGDMTINGQTRSVVLDVVFNGGTESYPFPPFNGKPAVGFNASFRILRSAFDLGLFAPYIADEVTVQVSVEAMELN